MEGPTADFSSPAGYLTIPGMTITDYWDNGPLLIIAQATFVCPAGLAASGQIPIFFDGAMLNTYPPETHCYANDRKGISDHILTPCSEGFHTVDLRFWATPNILSNIRRTSARLTVIQLGHWQIDPP